MSTGGLLALHMLADPWAMVHTSSGRAQEFGQGQGTRALQLFHWLTAAGLTKVKTRREDGQSHALVPGQLPTARRAGVCATPAKRS